VRRPTDVGRAGAGHARGASRPQLKRDPLDSGCDLPTMLRILGWVSFGLAAWYATRMWWLDRRMQAFRAVGARTSAFIFVPLRWQADLYTSEGAPLVRGAWRAFAAMATWFGIAALLLVLGS
jgi:hypothetical protein